MTWYVFDIPCNTCAGFILTQGRRSVGSLAIRWRYDLVNDRHEQTVNRATDSPSSPPI